MRVVKQAEIRKKEIMDAAEELFAQKGFDGTSTGDILEKVGIARGTLYYHFKAKAEIMDALIERKNVQLLDAARTIARDESIPVIERMVRALMALSASDIEDAGRGKMLEQLHKPRNALIHQKIRKSLINNVPPILSGMVCEAIGQGLFATPFPYESIEMLVVYALTIFDEETVLLSDEDRESRMQAFLHNAGRLLGLEKEKVIDLVRIFGTGDGGEL